MEKSHPPNKHILIALSGMTPAVVSETVYALIEKDDPPDLVVVVTTGRGLEAFRQLEKYKVWEKLRGMCGKEFRIITREPQGEDGRSTDDIISEDDNRNFANTLLRILRSCTEEPNTKISFSIAGGRKTMSAIGALCMTMLGRKQDKLYHILVDPPFDQPMDPPFFFPEPGVKHIGTNKRKYDSDKAKLHLSELPFVYTRYGWQETFQHLPPDFTSAVEMINEPQLIEIEINNQKLRIGTAKIITGETSGARPRRKLLLLYLLYHWQKFNPCEGDISAEQMVCLYDMFIKLKPVAIRNILQMHYLTYKDLRTLVTSEISRCFSELNDCLTRCYGQSCRETSLSFCASHGKYAIPAALKQYLKVSPELSEKDFHDILEACKKEKPEDNE